MGLLDKIVEGTITNVSTKVASAAASSVIRAVGSATAQTIGAIGKAIEDNRKDVKVISASNEAIPYIKVPNSADSYIGQNYHKVQAELNAFGFTNIALLAHDDLIVGLFTKDGSVEEVSINGDASFRTHKRFLANSRVVIKYHTKRG